jgi:hypothetical protein
MAMLLEPDVIARTWGPRSNPVDGSPPKDAPFWPEAIAAVKRRHPDFLFVAEVYWDMEWKLQQEGFDFTYDKRLYDRLEHGPARPVREHLMAAPDFRDRSLRFLENHDEPRAAFTFQPLPRHQAAAVVAFLVPGLRFFHEGQFEGRRQHVSMHVGRRPPEPLDEPVRAFYDRLLGVLRRPELHEGSWRLLSCRPAWSGNPTDDNFIASIWERGDTRTLIAVNYAGTQSQCLVDPGIPALRSKSWRLDDLMSDARYVRSGDELSDRGLFLDLPPWGYNVFELTPA